jgi:hypothetical protein
VWCPTGQLRNKEGRCVYPNKLWYNQYYVVYVNLTAVKPINVTGVFEYPFDAVSFVSPWGQIWSVLHIYYKVTDIKLFSDNFVFVVVTYRQRVIPGNMIRYIKKTVNQPWSLNLNNETIVLKSSNFTTSTLLYKNFHSTNMIVFDNITYISYRPKYNLEYNNISYYLPTPHLITKMYVCDQVELNHSEFTLSQDETTLYCYLTQRFLYDGEFIITKRNTFDKFRVRICIEDSELKSTNIKRNSGTILDVIDKFSFALILIVYVLYINDQF